MIKVIASDLDGTLLGSDHKIVPETVQAIKDACGQGIRFMLATGRGYSGAKSVVQDTGIVCDYILGSGAEVRDSSEQILIRHGLSIDQCREICKALENLPVSIVFLANEGDYRIGTLEEIEESIIQEMILFHENLSREEVVQTSMYRRIRESVKMAPDFQALEEENVSIFKLFIFSADVEMIRKAEQQLHNMEGIAVASSFVTNVEITDEKAQKGPVLKEYIESLGYSMDEVMVLGDSMNDLSMLEMDFGATIAMENAVLELKKVAKYITKSNDDLGVAYAIREVMKRNDSEKEKLDNV